MSSYSYAVDTASLFKQSVKMHLHTFIPCLTSMHHVPKRKSRLPEEFCRDHLLLFNCRLGCIVPEGGRTLVSEGCIFAVDLGAELI